MDKPKSIDEFDRKVKKKFYLYNSMFLNLPYNKVERVGLMIPILKRVCQSGLAEGKVPMEILDSFFEKHTNLESEEERIDFMFRVIQFVERQVVLFDSVEDAALPHIREMGDDLSVRDFLHQFNQKDHADDIIEKLSNFSARIVLTAHPTQFYPPRVLDIINRLRELVNKNDINNIDITLQQLGLTSLLNPQKPTPLEEAKNIIYFLRNVYYDASAELYGRIRDELGSDVFNNTGLIRLGFWPGGDRDGNPFVTAEITRSVADELRMSLMKCYYRDLKSLETKLTFSVVEKDMSNLKSAVYHAMFDHDRALSYKEIIDPLERIMQTVESDFNGLYLEDIENLVDKVKIFKTHFANLDIRQNHAVHKDAVEAIFKTAGIITKSIDELKEGELVDWLLNKNIEVDPAQYTDDLIRDTIMNIGQLKDIQEKNGEEGCNRYIISNSEDIYAVLFVYGLLRWCGKWGDELPMDIVPLFETMNGMEHSRKTMKTLFNLPQYRDHLQLRRDRQTIMLGFSDGTKDGGYLKANWSIFKTKEELSALCKEHEIKVMFFDGRGGPPARGGGKTNRFYASQSDRIASNEIQVTIQGQTISSKYGTREHFNHNVEQLLTAGLHHSLFGYRNTISGENRRLIEKLAEISFKKYSALKQHPLFIPYLENMSTLKFYGLANIGSRPAKRGQKKKLGLEDLRAISYVGSWSQLKQNVPGYFGIGTALNSLDDEGKIDELKRLFHEVPFFKALMMNSMMSLYKCYFELTSYIGKDGKYQSFWNMLYDEYLLSKKMLLKISGYEYLMQEEPISRKSIHIREQIVLPLLVIQQYALQKIATNTSYKTTYEKIVQRSLYGNINASRNSA